MSQRNLHGEEHISTHPTRAAKLFFFFDNLNDKIVSGSLVTRAVPSSLMRAGSISYYNTSNGVSTINQAGIAGYDPKGIGVDTNWLNFINKRFPESNSTSTGDGLNSLGFNFNADLGLGKKFPITAERVYLLFRADAFNALIHPNFALPAENVYNGHDQQDYQQGSGFGQISFTLVPPRNSNNGARVLQLSLRLEF
jgi:hypothetical protein